MDQSSVHGRPVGVTKAASFVTLPTKTPHFVLVQPTHVRKLTSVNLAANRRCASPYNTAGCWYRMFLCAWKSSCCQT